MNKIELKNEYIMVKEIVRKEGDKMKNGIYIPEETLEDEQVSQGEVVESNNQEYLKGDTIMFHKVAPVDANLRINEGDELTTFYFVKQHDIICKIVTV